MSSRRRASKKPGKAPRAAEVGAQTRARPVALRRWLVTAATVAVAGLLGAGLWSLLTSPDETGTTAARPPPAATTSGPPHAAPSMRSPVPVSGESGAIAWVDNAACLGCHAEQARLWAQSHHAMAMARPTTASVRGDFNDSVFTHAGATTRFFMREGRYFARTDGPDGQQADFEISYAFGVWPLQQYLVTLPGGRLQALQVAWDDQRDRWFHLRPDEQTPPGDVLHWTGRYQTANTMCITCHTTGFDKRYDAATDTFDSRWAEPNVSCQACHGPGERHVRWAQATVDRAPAPEFADNRFGLAVDRAALAGRQQVEVCAACHGRRSELTDRAVPGAPRLDHYLPVLLTAELYHPDGQQLDEVFVDGSFRQSRMYAMGVTCTDCHDAHTGKPRLNGNGLCLQCHTTPANARFATAAGAYDSPSHHFHAPGSPGAQCVSCHMPAKTYMQIQPRPDHSLRVPRPDLSVQLGTPNACNQCHANESAQWAADQVARWYGPDRRQEPHYAEVFAAARSGRPDAAQGLTRIAGDPAQPGIVRATALDSLRQYPAADVTARIAATRDVDAEVRAAAATSLESAAPGDRLGALTPLLTDPVRAVRIAAARSLSSIDGAAMSRAQRGAFNAALDEYVAAQSVALDMPGPRLNLAVVYENTGRPSLAEEQYLAALRIDPDFTPARSNLATLYNALGRNADAERVLAEGLAREPDIGELQYSLGLILAEEHRLPEAAAALAKASALLPDRARTHYNLGLALQQLGRREAAAAALHTAAAVDPNDPAIAYALAIFHAQGGERATALEWAARAQALAPADPQITALVGQLRTN